MPLKIFVLQLQDKSTPLANKRKVEHLLIKHSGIKITLNESINIITSVALGNEVEVLFNTAKLDVIEAAFLKHSISVALKVK